MKAAAYGAALALAFSFGLAFAPAARAQESPRAEPDAAGPLRLGLRTGYGLPIGRYADIRNFAGFRDDDVNALGDDTYGVIPLWLDAGYALTPHWLLGAYFAFGIVLPRSAPATNPLSGGCPEGVDCAATGVRAGIAVEYSFTPQSSTRPWLGLGIGYEWVSSTIEDRNISLKLESLHHGPELLQLSGGADFQLSPSFGLGPFATLSALQYTSCSLTFRGEQTCEIEDAAWHGWVLLGVRGVVRP